MTANESGVPTGDDEKILELDSGRSLRAELCLPPPKIRP